jgi:hypothetical protein
MQGQCRRLLKMSEGSTSVEKAVEALDNVAARCFVDRPRSCVVSIGSGSPSHLTFLARPVHQRFSAVRRPFASSPRVVALSNPAHGQHDTEPDSAPRSCSAVLAVAVSTAVAYRDVKISTQLMVYIELVSVTLIGVVFAMLL